MTLRALTIQPSNTFITQTYRHLCSSAFIIQTSTRLPDDTHPYAHNSHGFLDPLNRRGTRRWSGCGRRASISRIASSGSRRWRSRTDQPFKTFELFDFFLVYTPFFANFCIFCGFINPTFFYLIF